MVKSLLVHFPEIGRLKDEGENTPLNLFVCKSVMKGVSWGLLFLWLGVISCASFANRKKVAGVACLGKWNRYDGLFRKD